MVTFLFNGITKVPIRDREIIIDGSYSTNDEIEIITLSELKFREAEEEVVVEKPKRKPRKKKNDKDVSDK